MDLLDYVKFSDISGLFKATQTWYRYYLFMTFAFWGHLPDFYASNEIEAYTSTLGLLTHLLAHSLTHLSAESSCIPFEATEIICKTGL